MACHPVLSWRIRFFFLVVIASVAFCASPAKADSFDWRNVGGYNWNTPVKNQFGGTCWDFSSCGTLEAKYKLTRNDSVYNPDVSEQHICWETNPDMGSTGGGWGSSVLNYFTSHGVVSEAECPYQSSSPDTGIAPYWPLATGWESRVWKSVSNANNFSTDLNTIKSYLKTQGPLEIGIWAGHDLYDTVAQLKAQYSGPDGSSLDHEVVLVGYYDDAAVPTGGYWVIKNSWGSGGGDGTGYYYIPYGNVEIHNDISAITGPVYYTGEMSSATWKGGTATWSSGGNNWTKTASNGTPVTPATYAWENKETGATFDTANTAPITISGAVIAHGLKFASGATGYSFTGGALTVTGGGITADESVSFASPVYIGGPQTWNVAAGKNATVSGAFHTIISDVTFAGAGDKVISGAIDGGGVLNTYGGAKPGGLIQSGTGTLTLSGTTNFSGDITAQTGSGTMYINIPGGSDGIFNGAWNGGGTVSVNSSGTFTLGGGASNFTGTLIWQQPISLIFTPAAGSTSTFASQINNDGSVTQDGAGVTVFSNRLTNLNNYTGGTTIKSGVLQANSGNGLPTTSFLTLDGGILQVNGSSSVVFSRSLGTIGSAFAWTENGGGFSASTGTMLVNIPGGALTWSSDPADLGSKILGTLKLSSWNAQNITYFLNPVNLNGADRTVQVDDNPNSTADYATMNGAISGTGGIVKTGNGILKLGTTNSFTGATNITNGVVQANIGQGIPANSLIQLNGGLLQLDTTSTFTSVLGTAGPNAFQLTGAGGGFTTGSIALTINSGNDKRTLTWGTNVGSEIVGPLTLNGPTAQNNITMLNGINLNGGERSLIVNAKRAYLSGAISDGIGGGSLVKTGTGSLAIDGTTGNTFTGPLKILGGNVYLNKTSGYAVPGDFVLGGSSQIFVSLQANNQFAPTSKWIWAGTGAWQEIKLLGHNQTCGGLSDATTHGVVENTWDESSYGSATLTINTTSDCSFNGVMRTTCYGSGVGAINLLKTGPAKQTLVGGNITYTGTTTISEGTLAFQNVTDASILARNIVTNGTFEINYTDSTLSPNFSGMISGTGGVTKTGSYTATLSGGSGNTYTGTTLVNGGTLILAKTAGYAVRGNLTLSGGSTYVVVNGSNQIAPTSMVTFDAAHTYAHLEVSGNTVTVGGINGTGVLENTESESGVGNGTLIVDNAIDCAFSGYLRDHATGGSGMFSLVKNGTGTLTITGSSTTNQYTGGLTVNAGTLMHGNGSLPACPFTINGGTFNIGAKTKTIPSFKITGGLVTGTVSGSTKGRLTSSTAYDVQGGQVDIILAGTNAALNKTGTGTAILNGANTYSGQTTVSGGTLQIGVGSTTGTIANSVVQIDADGTLLINHSDNITYSSNKIRGTGTFVQGGTNTLTMSGNSFSGNVGVNSGTLVFSTGSTLPIGNYSVAGGTLNLNALSQTIAGLKLTGGTINGTGTLASSTAYDLQNGTAAVALGGSAGLNKSTAGTVSITSALPGGNYAISGGTLNINGLSKSILGFQLTGGSLMGTGTITSETAFDVQNGVVGAVLAGASGLVKSEDGVVVLESTATYTGTTQINTGTLALTSNGHINELSPVNNAATFLLADGTHTLNSISGTGSTLVGNGAVLNVPSLVQDTLTIGGDYSAIVSMASPVTQTVAVPEPSVLALLATLAVALAAGYLRRR
jgi:autotransporter-associated beta strand protein